jgi:hypothetical protein
MPHCKACDELNGLPYDPPDYYCKECIDIIMRTAGKKFTLSDAYRIVVGNDSMVSETGRKTPVLHMEGDNWGDRS